MQKAQFTPLINCCIIITMKTVLVVDDSKIMRNIVKKYFSAQKIPRRYLEAANGIEALEQTLNESIDLVFLNWNMPEMTGIDFLKQVRAIEKYKKLPIIMVTGEAARYNVIEALKLGATDYIIKPINGKLFAEKISNLVL